MGNNYSSVPRMFEFSILSENGQPLDYFLEVHIVTILDGYGIEVAIQSIANPENPSYVVITREAERFVNEIHDHKGELRSSNEWLTAFQREQDGSYHWETVKSVLLKFAQEGA